MPVNALEMAKDVCIVVLLPTITGVLLNEALPKIVRKIRPSYH